MLNTSTVIVTRLITLINIAIEKVNIKYFVRHNKLHIKVAIVSYIQVHNAKKVERNNNTLFTNCCFAPYVNRFQYDLTVTQAMYLCNGCIAENVITADISFIVSNIQSMYCSR